MACASSGRPLTESGMPPSPIGKTSTSPRRRVAVLVVALMGGAYPVGPDARGPGRVGRAPESPARGSSASRISLILVYAPRVLEPFHLVFVQRGVLEVAALAIGAGLVGTWIVLRGLAFYAHAVGTRDLPGARARRRPRVPAPPRARWRGRARRRRRRRLAGPARPRALRQRDRARPRRRAGRGRAPGQRRLPLRRARRDAAVRQPARSSTTATSWFAAGASAVVAGRLALSRPPLAGDRLRPGGGARAGRPLRACPTPRCSSLVALVAVAALSAVGALLATALLVVPAATTRLRVLAPADVAARDAWRSPPVEGVAGLWLSVRDRTRRPGRRSPCSAAPCSRSSRPRASLRARRRTRAPALAATAVARWRSPSPAAASGRAAGGGRPRRGRRHHDAARRLRARGRRDAARRDADPAAQRRPARVRAAPERRRGRGRRRRSSSRAATALDALDGRGRRAGRRAPAPSSTSAPPCRSPPGEPRRARTASRFDPHWWHDPRQRRGGRGADPRRAHGGRPGRPRGLRAQRHRLRARGCAASTPAIRRCIAAVPPRAAQARHRPRRVRLLRRAATASASSAP